MLAGLARASKTCAAVVSAAWIQSGMPIPSKAIPVKKSRGITGELAADRLDALLVAQNVLGHGPRVAGDPQQEWIALNPDHNNSGGTIPDSPELGDSISGPPTLAENSDSAASP